jgi:hypothetical protein
MFENKLFHQLDFEAEHSATDIGNRIAFPNGTVQYLTTSELLINVPARYQTFSLSCPFLHRLPRLSSTSGLLPFGWLYAHCHHFDAHSSNVSPYGFDSTGKVYEEIFNAYILGKRKTNNNIK